MSVADRVKLLIDNQNLTQKKFADSIGISPARLNNYLAGLSKVPQDILIKITDTYNLNIAWLITGTGDMFNSTRPREGALSKLIRLPVVGDIAAGFPAEVVPDEPSEFIEVSTSLLTLPPPYFAFRVEGESMSPFILDGDIVILSRDWRGLKLNNRICGFRTQDGITLKKMVIQPKQKTTWLMPLNHSYEPIPYNRDTEDLIFFGVLCLSLRYYT